MANPSFGGRQRKRARRRTLTGCVLAALALGLPERFLRLFAALARELPWLHAIMIGSGPLEAQVRARIHELGCGPRLRLLRDDEAVLSMPAADVFVSTSRYEGLPYVVLEAQSVGLPVVAFGTGGLSTALDPGKHVMLIDFTILSSLLHGAVMTYDAFAQEHEMTHLVGDVPLLFVLAGVLLWLHPRRLYRQPLAASTAQP